MPCICSNGECRMGFIMLYNDDIQHNRFLKIGYKCEVVRLNAFLKRTNKLNPVIFRYWSDEIIKTEYLTNRLNLKPQNPPAEYEDYKKNYFNAGELEQYNRDFRPMTPRYDFLGDEPDPIFSF